ncbi:MAG: hypothetical protein A2Y17_01430 [Clostridiales bacterium GWF2_38_85]|nr:MAG: hypothetical protein A2Y17_01430 [Clostridiales bacterium GWF2_38_85]HBL85182.1 hypothetical protein [Clostridiales bacterium]
MNFLEKTGKGVKKIIEKIKEVDYKKILNNKVSIMIGSFLLIGAVVTAVAVISGQIDDSKDVLNNESQRSLGQSVLVNGDVSDITEEVDEEDYFTVAAMTRETVREEAMDVLQQIIDNPDVLPDTKDDAMADMNALVAEMTKEVNIETLVKAKGITEVLAVLSGNNCNVIVKTEGLLDSSVAQILEIVYNETGIHPDDIKIIETT